MGGPIRPGSWAASARARALRSRLPSRSATLARARLLGSWAVVARARLFGSWAVVARARLFGSWAVVARVRLLGPCAVVALLAGAGGLAAGCGGEPAPSDGDQVRATLVEFGRATASRDYRAMCDRLLAPALVEKLREIGLPCEQALEQGLGDVRAPKLTVGRITVRGDTARAAVRTSAEGQQPSDDTVELRRVNGSWRIASLAGAGG